MPARDRQVIKMLLERLKERKDLKFVRADKTYNAKEAAWYLKYKWDQNKEKVHSVDDFIHLSSYGGEHGEITYYVKLSDGTEKPAKEVLEESAKKLEGVTLLFLVTTVATSVTGFFFHRDHLLPSHVVGIISLVLLGAVIIALYGFHLRGVWRIVYVIGAVASLYFNVFVLIVQGFLKLPFLHALAPTQTEPAFLAVQGLALLVFLAIGVLSFVRFRPLATA